MSEDTDTPVWTLHYKSGKVVEHLNMVRARCYAEDGRRKVANFTQKPSKDEIEAAYAAERQKQKEG